MAKPNNNISVTFMSKMFEIDEYGLASKTCLK